MEQEKIKRFLDLLEASSSDWMTAFAEAGSEAFGCDPYPVDVLAALGIPHTDAEVIFTHLPDDPATLAAYLRPRLLNTPD